MQNGTTQQGAAPSARPSRVKVAFSLNVPQILTLEFEPPQEARPGNWGDQFMYFCADERIAFMEPVVHEKLLALNAHAGETFAITKCGKGVWEVQRPFEAEASHHRAAPPLRSAPRTAAPRETAPPPIREGHEASAANPMAQALTQAMEAVRISGFDEASREDIRALAITIYISTTGGRK